MNPRRRLFRRLDRASAALAGRGTAEERVHEARRQLKKAKALLALGRSAVGRGRARRAKADLREAGRALSGVRDAQAAERSYRSMRIRPRGPQAALLARRKAAERSAGLAAAAAERRLDAARRELAGMGRPGRRDLGRAAAAALACLQDRAQAALLSPLDENLHAWRKAAKRLHGMLGEIPSPTPRLRALRRRLSRLGEVLGEDHDLVILRAALERDGGCPAVEPEASRRRALLLEKAARLAEGLARTPPRALARDFRRSL